MKTWVKVKIILVIGLIAALWYQVTQFRPRPCNLISQSPDGEVSVSCLPFKGVESHPLDGCIRVYVQGDTLQTALPCDGDITIVWHNDADRSFSLYKEENKMMTWKTIGAEAICTLGENLITYDPHQLWGRTGKSRP